MKIVNWFWDHFWNLFMNRTWKLPAKGKSGMVEPNWYPPSPAPPAIIEAQIVEDQIVALQSHSDLFKKVIDKETRAYVKIKRKILSPEKINEAITLGAKRFFEQAYLDKDDNDVLFTSGVVNLEEYMMKDFYEVFKSVCNQYGIKVSLNHKAIWAKRDQLKSIFNKGLEPEPTQVPEIDDAMRKLLQPGPYR